MRPRKPNVIGLLLYFMVLGVMAVGAIHHP